MKTPSRRSPASRIGVLVPSALLAYALLGPTTVRADQAGGLPAVPRAGRMLVESAVNGGIDDGKRLLLGPSQPQVDVPSGLDCDALYERRLALIRAGLDYRKPFWDDARTQGALLIGTVWTPAFYYLPYSAFIEAMRSGQAPRRQAELDALRQASAKLRCYER